MASRNDFSKKTLIMIIMIATTISPSSLSQVINPRCLEKCGDVNIPYPFGIGTDDCFFDIDFEISCNTSFNPPKPFMGDGNVEVLSISLEGQLRVLLFAAYDCYNDMNEGNYSGTITTLPSFPFSYTRNKFIAIGCDTLAVINGESSLTTGCLSVCNNEDSITDGSCSGIGCCQTSIPRGLLNYNVSLSSFNNHSGILDFNPCSYSFLAEEEAFKFSKSYLSNFSETYFPAVLDWAVGEKTCKDAMGNNSSAYACKSSFSMCNETDNGPGYRCSCLPGYQGNAYIPNGCQDINECANATLNNCNDIYFCNNTNGSFMCQCPMGYHGNGTDEDPCVAASTSVESLVIQLTTGIGGGLLVMFICSLLLYFALRKRRHLQLKEKFFRQNGGLMLQQELATRKGYNDSAKIFSAEELEKATNKYDESRIIGKGGYGTVYKGFLTPDNREVAIKKSKLVDQSQIEQFINEVVVLSQINHRNIVKLLGCCLETEVPLLVYEFVRNGTLFEHICDEKTMPAMSWDTRLRIAAETAGVLSYLHSAASIPIIHRDVKSTNILLDENLVAKVADFGASKLVPLDHNELSTMVQGTLGYLDPEYLQTSQLTEKSDVYSFGVVLVELLTGKKPLSFDKPEKEKNLANYFLASIKEDFLFQILEDVVLKQGNPEQLREVANLAKNCLKVRGDDRPTMKEVAMELEGLRVTALGKHAWVKGDMISEESESLLGNIDLSDSFDFRQNASTSIVYDSMKDHVVLTVAGSGR